MVAVPLHASYANPTLPSVSVRGLVSQWEAQGDPDRAAKFIYDLVNSTGQLPIRLAVGLDAIEMIKEKVKVLQTDLGIADKAHEGVVLTRTG
jgi:hypothetical protein